MAHGKTIVASRVGGIPGVVEAGVTGTLVAPADPSGLARALAPLLASPAERRAQGEAGRRRVEREFSPALCLGRVARLYAETAGKRTRP